MISFKYESYDLTLALTVSVIAFFALLVIKAFMVRQLHRLSLLGHLQFLGYLEQIINATRLPFLLTVSLLAGVSQLDITPRQEKWLHYAWTIILVMQIALWGTRIIAQAVQNAFDRQRESNPSGATHLMLVGLIGRIVLWSIAILAMLDNLGFNISTLMASLGIGGVAVALAVQNILGDVFSSISIALDKPFVIGDFIVVDSFLGSVEYIGMKTTRLRSLDGEQIIFSNSELLKNRIRNYKRMMERRVLFEFGISYETSTEDIEIIPSLVKDIISSGKFETRFDRAHFKDCGSSALLYEVVYYVLDPDYNKHMDIQQAIKLALLKEFRIRGIGFAYPTQTLYLAPAGNWPSINIAAQPAAMKG